MQARNQYAALADLKKRRDNGDPLNESQIRILEWLEEDPEPNQAIKEDLSEVAQYIKWA